MSGNSIKNNQSVEKVFDIIEAMAKYSVPIRLLDLAEILKMPTPTVYRFLNTLVDNEYVRKEEESSKYYLTLKLNYLTNLIHDQFNIQKVIHPYLRELSNITGETSSLVVEQDKMAVYIDKVESSTNMVKSFQRIGYRAPLYCTAVGKIFLSEMKEDLKSYLNQENIEKLTQYTITEEQELSKELMKIKKSGFSYDNEECEIGARCIAMPIKDYTGRIIAAISISGPVTRMTDSKIDDMKIHLLRIHAEISKILGYLE